MVWAPFPCGTGQVVSHLEDDTGLLDTEAGEKVPDIPLLSTVEISVSQVSYVSCLDFAYTLHLALDLTLLPAQCTESCKRLI